MDIISSPKVGCSLPKPSCLLWEALVCEKHIPKPAPNGTKKLPRHVDATPYDSMPSFMNFRRVLDLLEFKNQASQCFAGNQQCPRVWNSFTFLAWDLSMDPRTLIWFFNQFICTGACACSSNLNYALKYIENSVNAYKCPNEPRKIKKIHTTLLLFYVDTRKKIVSNKRQWIPFRPQRWDVP